MKHIHLLLVISTVFTAASVFAGDAPPKPYKGSAEFERLKPLVGTWKTTHDMGQGPMEVSLQYRLVSGGSVLEERIFAGTPMEMVTMYHDKGGKLSLTHYCMLANQPGMLLKSSDAKSLRFDFDKTCGINPKTETHMHALRLTFVDSDTLEQDWAHWQDGKRSDHSPKFTFKRAKN